MIGTIPQLSIDKCIKDLSTMYINVINNGTNISKMPSVMLWGQPGIGKSQSIRELASVIEANTKKKVYITDVRLILFNPVDLRGIPTANADKTLAVWLKPKVFDMSDKDDVINILFLDEISAAAPSVQAAAYQITLDRRIGEHTLPDNCIVIAAGNRVTDKSVAYTMPKALSNRLLHLEIENDIESWNRWAIESDIHHTVIAFLKYKPDYLNKFDPSNQELAFSTPRSWEMVSNILNNVSNDINVVFDLIAGLVGNGVAIEFKGFYKVFSKLPKIENIFNGTETIIPKETDVLFALCSSIVSYAKKKNITDEEINNSIRYANMLPADYAFILLKDYLALGENFKRKLLTNSEYLKWLNTKGKILNAAYR